MQGKRILVIGYGKLGRRVANELSLDHHVIAVKRSVIDEPSKLALIYADVTDGHALKKSFEASLTEEIDYVIYCLSPSERSEKGYENAYLVGLNNVMNALPNAHNLEHVFFVSSSSVYHQSNDEIVDEESECLPKSYSGKILLAAENVLTALDIPSTAIRFSGIYGGNRSRLIDQVKEALKTGKTLQAATGYTNRIHEDDCLGFICHLVSNVSKGNLTANCYLASDNCPVEKSAVFEFIAKQLSEVGDACYHDKTLHVDILNDPILRRVGSKRCENKRMRESGYRLKYTSYQEGYLATLNQHA